MSTGYPTRGRSTTWTTTGVGAPPMPAGIAAGIGFAAAILATVLAVAFGSTHDPLWALVPLGLVTAVIAATTTWVGAVATAWICWSLDSGFVVGREAQLTFSRPAQLAALILIAIAVLAGITGRAVRLARNNRLAMSSQPIQSANEWPDTVS